LDIEEFCPYCTQPLKKKDLLNSYIKTYPKKITRNSIFQEKWDIMSDYISKSLYKLEDTDGLENKLEIYNTLMKYMYENRYYIRNKKFINMVLYKTYNIYEDNPETFIWYFKFRNYFGNN
tara:strand:+ start:203 stop:562 length:360 start_codon:yes stop_codon:yes gene_type:complete